MRIDTNTVNQLHDPIGGSAGSISRLGIDGEGLRRPLSGVGRYVFSICKELERLLPDAELFAYSRLPATRLELPSSRWTLRCEPNPLLRRVPSFLWLKTRGAALCQRDRLDLFWANRTLHPRLRDSICTVCTVHDVNHLVVPETMQSSTLWSHRAWFLGDLARAHGVVANSLGTAGRIRQLLNREWVDVVSPGLEPSFQWPPPDTQAAAEELATLGVQPPYLLSVSTFEPRKNLRALLDAFLELKTAGELNEHRLVVAGATGWKNRELSQALDAAASLGVVAMGYVPDRLLPTLYANAEMFVMPSVYEGFGMPVLEARACGARVVVSDIPELREAGGPHAVAVEPTKAGIQEGIRRALRLPRIREVSLAREHSWSQAAAQLLAVFQSTLDARKGSHAGA